MSRSLVGKYFIVLSITYYEIPIFPSPSLHSVLAMMLSRINRESIAFQHPGISLEQKEQNFGSGVTKNTNVEFRLY